MDTPRQQRPVVHLIGSVPLEDPETVMRTLSTALGAHLRRMPDGETGRRARWIAFVQRHLQQHADMEVDPDIPVYQFKQWDGKLIREWQQLKFKAGVDPSTVVFDTGYADDAIHGFAIFDRLQSAGVIPAAVKYQVCIATPLAIAYMFIAPRTRADSTRVYTQHLRQEVNRIAQMLPHNRLALQWDVCQEVLMWEGYFAMDRKNKSPFCAATPAVHLRRRPPLACGACHTPSVPPQPAGAARSKAQRGLAQPGHTAEDGGG
jgi:hypothetical protein